MSFYCPECGQGIIQDAQSCSCCGIPFGKKYEPVSYTPPGPIDSHGRIGRLSYFLTGIFLSVVSGFLSFAIAPSSDGGWIVFCIFILLPTIYISFAAAIKRLHDLGQSGWWSLLSFIPFINLGLGIYLLFFKGMPGVNKYGPPVDGIGSIPNQQRANAISIEPFRATETVSLANKTNGTTITSETLASESIEDAIYEKIGQELESNKKDIAAWTKAYAESNGDETKARVSYINIRLEKLLLAHKQAISAAEKIKLDETKENERIKNLSVTERFKEGFASGEIDSLKRTQKGKEFLCACKDKPLSYIRAFIEENLLFVGVDDPQGNTGLHIAIIEGREDVAELLLQSGASPIKKNLNGKTPLMLAEICLPGVSRVTMLLQEAARKSATSFG